MKAAVLTAKDTIEIRDVPKPSLREGQVLVKIAYAGVCGSDIHAYHGEFGTRVKFPRILGHEFSGVIEEVGGEVGQVSAGQRVVVDTVRGCGRCAACIDGRRSACRSLTLEGIDADGGFAEYIAVDGQRIYVINDSISLRDAALVEIYSIGVHACRRGGVQPGDFAVIFGCGRVGFSILECVKECGASKIAVVDVSEQKLEKARMVGADYTVNAMKENPTCGILKLSSGRGADIVFEAIGDAKPIPNQTAPLAACVEVMRGGGRIVVLGQGPDEIPIFWKEFVWKEGTIIASRVTLGEFPRALGFMGAGKYHPDIFISEIHDLEETAEAFRSASEPDTDILKILLKVSGQ